MKITPITKKNFQELSQLDKIEFLLRKEVVKNNIRKSLPTLEVILIFFVLAYSRLFSLSLLSAMGPGEVTLKLINLFSMFFNTLIVIFFISFITRIIIYFQKHKQLSELHEEFLDRLHVSRLNDNLVVNKTAIINKVKK